MRSSRRATRRWATRIFIACGLIVWAGGCQSPQGHPDPRNPAITAEPVATHSGEYTVVFPDYVQIDVPNRPEWTGHYLVPPDGRITLQDGGVLLLEGATINQVRQRIAEITETPVDRITCRVTHPRSRVVYLLGSVKGEPRAVPYAGPERVLQLLERTGGLTPTADRGAITVTRRNVAHGTKTETYRVDWDAIQRGDSQSNILLEPNDEIMVGEQERSLLDRTIGEVLGR